MVHGDLPRQHPCGTTLRFTGPCAGGLSAVNAIGTQLRDPINSGLTRWRCCCFSHSAHWLPTRKKVLYTVANPARGLLNREKKEKKVYGGFIMDAAAELGRNPVSKHQIQPEYGDEQADAGRDG